MDHKVAEHVCRVAFRCSRELAELLPFAAAFCESRDHQALLKAVATVTDSIRTEIMDPLLDSNAGLREQVDASVETYGVFI